MVIERIPAIAALSKDDQRRLLDELWTRLADEDTEVDSGDPVRVLLDARMTEYRANPAQASPWPAVREPLRNAAR